MAQWTAEIGTDPLQGHRLYVELLEDDRYRARLYEDDTGNLQLQLYDGLETVIPVQWLLDIVARLTHDLQAAKQGKGKKGTKGDE